MCLFLIKWCKGSIDFSIVSTKLFCEGWIVCFPVSNFSKSRILSINLFNLSDSEMIFCKNCFFNSSGISSSSCKISLAALIAVIGVRSSCVTVSKNSSFCWSFIINDSLASCNFAVITFSSLEVSVNFLLMMIFSFDSSKIFNTSGKVIFSSFTTLEIRILAEAVPIWPVNKFSENLIKRASANSIFLSTLYFTLKIFMALLVLSSPKNRINTFSISFR